MKMGIQKKYLYIYEFMFKVFNLRTKNEKLKTLHLKNFQTRKYYYTLYET